ncbi:MAG: LysM peptidoglycan-binding domain-containing protein [Chloroflexi bacterium]|nr:LysM peptidoglycan-binding domain-containing protein [Chloroflexota bacterium]
MKKSTWILVLVSLVVIGGAVLSLPNAVSVQAAPQPQMTNFPTPTPGSDGRIVYIVQEGDTLWRIAAVSGIDVADLRDLNLLDADDIVYVGMQLFLGLGGPSADQATQAPARTEAAAEPTLTPIPGNGTLCVLLFEDLNGDSMRQEEEITLAAGAINISNRDGSVSITEDTPAFDINSDTEGYLCKEGLQEGDYNVSVAIPEGYNPTTSLNTGVELMAGDITYLTFGAQAGSVVIEESAGSAEQTGSTPFLGIMGIILLLGGIGLGVYSVWFRGK